MSAADFPETADIETSSEDYASRFAGGVGRYFLDEQTRITLELLGDVRGSSVLDVGGAHCQLAQPLSERGCTLTITGSDDICGVRAAARLPAGRCTYQTCNSLALPFADNAFPIVLCFRLLPHVDDWQGLLRELCRVSSGVVLFDYPDIRSSNLLYRLLFDLKKSMEGNTRTYTLFSRGQVEQELVANNFHRPAFRPEFFWPMVVHRALKQPRLSRLLEAPPRWLGLTRLLGSPIIVRAIKHQSAPWRPGKR
ncbi:class I SAM-dependent methyltransferase [uncultured Desulfobulbus sp.]|uniref:class I SAM-dependent methyltransferase n=1 Tax=uncultured Desulfobulbus sp. TaxID=239745 RepID=UPI00260F14DE|nr:class I SAM-dependent methyltransferase [uncultured Desulfobulbus sp.]